MVRQAQIESWYYECINTFWDSKTLKDLFCDKDAFRKALKLAVSRAPKFGRLPFVEFDINGCYCEALGLTQNLWFCGMSKCEAFCHM